MGARGLCLHKKTSGVGGGLAGREGRLGCGHGGWLKA